MYPFEDELGLICGLSAADFDSLSEEIAGKFASREMFFRRADSRIVMRRLDTKEPVRVIP